MSKKSEITGTVYIYILAALCIAIVAIFGFKAFANIKDKNCVSKLTLFQEEIKAMAGSMASGAGERRGFHLCSATKIYFFDREKDISLADYTDNPVLNDVVKSKPKENVFVMNDEKLVYSFSLDNAGISYPYFSCIKGVNGYFKIYFKGKPDGKSDIKAETLGADCSYVEVKNSDLTPDEFIEIKDDCNQGEFVDEHGSVTTVNCPSQQPPQTSNVQTYRKIYCPPGEEEMNVEIKVDTNDPEKRIKYFEEIPKNTPEGKECLNSIMAQLVDKGEATSVAIKEDPLIMWEFRNDYKYKTSYNITLCLSDECKELIKGAVTSG